MLGGLFKSKKNAASEVQELFSRAMVIEEPAEQPPLEEPVTKVVQEKYQEPALVEQEELSRTGRVVFVGNVALECTLKEIARHFRPYGNVERVWFRSVPVDRKDKKIPIRAAVIIKQFQQGAKVKNCYVLFDSVESAKASLKLNNTLFKEFHLRVDLADRKKRELTNTVFIGNVPFAAEEETVRSLCEATFGEVENVRLIRDRVSRVGKGFGYIKFKKFASFNKALQAGTFKYDDREVRVTKAHALKTEPEPVAVNAKNAAHRIQRKAARDETQKLVTQKIKKSIKKLKKNPNITPKEAKGRVAKLKGNLTQQVRDTNIFNRA